MTPTTSSVLALDVGAKRIGVAVASFEARLPRPVTTLIFDDQFFTALKKIVAEENVTRLVIGFPRGLQGQHTSQTDAIEAFAKEIKEHLPLPTDFQDEALTSKHAEDELRGRGKPYAKADIDALAATYILDDWLAEYKEVVA
ncbi:MAG TPA: Holliday junction resolvase RuvX [Methylomirabilota bacterium]|nr:Holliday junction resolvase RuvX [Methylomirabilota bacterium]